MKEAKSEPDYLYARVFSFTGNIFQSEGELKIQKQNRIRNMIRNRIEKERSTFDQGNLIDPSIETKRFNNTNQLNEENG